MPRLMSVSHTAEQVEARTKTETRRKGWLMLKPGDRLTLCRKVMGRMGAPLERLAEVEVTAVRREPLDLIDDDGVAAEGFPQLSPEGFVRFFVLAFGGERDQLVTVISWRYLDA